MQPIHILLLDASPQGFSLLSQLLVDPSMYGIISWARTMDEALFACQKESFDIALVDNILGQGETGFDLLKHEEFKALGIPVVFLASYGDEYTAVRALKAGAFDYLIKDYCDSSRLIYSINEAIRDARYRKQVEAHQIELIKLASTDGLTGLLNRRHFRTCLDREISRFIRYRLPLSIAMIDVDHFKNVNDQYGHDAGDYVLKELSRVLKESVRTTDTVGRYGGEEFIIAFPNTALLGAEALAERLRERIEHHLFGYNHMSIPVTVSIGVAEALDEIAHTDTLFKLADKALYAAKKDGRNTVLSYKYGVGL